MKKISLLICGLLLQTTLNAQNPKLTPQQQIERQRNEQVKAQELPLAPAVNLNTAKTVPTAPIENNTATVPNPGTNKVEDFNVREQNVPDQQSPDNIGGAGTSGTAPNTTGAPIKKTPKAVNTNRQTTTLPNLNISNGTNGTRRGTNTK